MDYKEKYYFMTQKLKILQFPDPKLRKVAKKVTKFDKSLQNLASDMLHTMYEENGIGLAATQVDHHIRLIVMDLSEKRNEPMFFVNPEYKILDNHSTCSYEEGCLSLPNVCVTVPRFQSIRVQAQDISGEYFDRNFIGLEAICIQHEIDHLLGKTFIDYLDEDLKKNVLAEYHLSQSILSEQTS